MRIFKLVFSILIILSIVISDVPITAEAGEFEYVKIKVTRFDDYDLPIEINMMVSENHVYVKADDIADLFLMELTVDNGGIVMKNEDKFQLIIFYQNSEKVEYTLGMSLLNYIAPFKSIINEQGAWIPFEMSLFLLDSSYLITDNGIHIETPKQTAVKTLMSVIKTGSNYYNFDMIKEFGYSDFEFNAKGGASHLVNFFNGILGFDPSSWGVAFTQIFGDPSPYDAKYGDALSTMFCTNSQEELKSYAKQIESLYGFNKSISILKKLSDFEVGQLDRTLQLMANRLQEINPPTITYNSIYSQLDKALKNQSLISNIAAPLEELQKNFPDEKYVDIISYGIQAISYASEFSSQDEFAIDAMKRYLSSIDENSLLPATSINKFRSNVLALENNLVMYSLSNLIQENWFDFVTSKSGLQNKLLGPQGMAIKFAWDMASNTVPFVKDGLESADKFELSCYAMVFQTDARNVFHNNVMDTLRGNYKNSELLRGSVYDAYTYLKSCYIARESGIDSTKSMRENMSKNMSEEDYKKVQDYFQLLNDKNTEIAEIMAQLKVIACSDDVRMLGYLPEVNEDYLKMYDEEKLISYIRGVISTTSRMDTNNDKNSSRILQVYKDYVLNKMPFEPLTSGDIHYVNFCDLNFDGIPELLYNDGTPSTSGGYYTRVLSVVDGAVQEIYRESLQIENIILHSNKNKRHYQYMYSGGRMGWMHIYIVNESGLEPVFHIDINDSDNPKYYLSDSKTQKITDGTQVSGEYYNNYFDELDIATWTFDNYSFSASSSAVEKEHMLDLSFQSCVEQLANLQQYVYTHESLTTDSVNDISLNDDNNVESKNKLVAAGYGHSAAIMADGTLWVWGKNHNGQIGDGTNIDKLEPIKVLENVVSVDAGADHTVAIKNDGSLWAWGFNSSGQLGNGTLIDEKSPIKIMDNVVNVSAGPHSTLAITNDGTLWMWGDNRREHLNGNTYKSSPVKVMDNVFSASGTDGYYTAIKTDGTLWAWGYPFNGFQNDIPVKIMDNVKSVSPGYYTHLVVKDDSSLWIWGFIGGSNGFIENTGEFENSDSWIETPQKIMDNVKFVSTGMWHYVIIKEDGSLWGWGSNQEGALGNGTNQSQNKAIKIMDNVVSAEVGRSHTIAIKNDGSLWTWGRNAEGQIGDGTITTYEQKGNDVLVTNNDKYIPTKIME